MTEVEKRKQLLKELKNEADLRGISIDEISLKSGMIKSNVSRVLEGKYSPTLDIYLLLKKIITDSF